MQRTSRASSASKAGPRPDATLSATAEADVLSALLASAAARDSSSEVGAIALPPAALLMRLFVFHTL
jgi:hypothetical protein